MAAPHFAGTVALMQSIRARSPAQVRTILRQSARPIPVACGRCPDRMLSAEAAVSQLRGRLYANGNRRAITENAGQLRSVLDVDRGGQAPANLRVAVSIRHPRPQDLIVALQAPGGQYFRLHGNADTGTGGIHQTYSVNAAGLPAAGRWALTYRDDVTGQTGTLEQWQLMF